MYVHTGVVHLFFTYNNKKNKNKKKKVLKGWTGTWTGTGKAKQLQSCGPLRTVPAICDFFTMSVKLNALFSDSYVDISQYRDQHFKVSGEISANTRGL